MKRFYLIAFFYIAIINLGFSQKSLNDYSYVVVSEQFEFQKEKDKYELNSFAKFLFNKHGFHAFFDREVPVNVGRCEGLWAEAEGGPGFVYTHVVLVLRDCNGDEVLRTRKGTSKIKDYKKSYYQAMRGAFQTIIAKGVRQKSIETSLVRINPISTTNPTEKSIPSTKKTSPKKDPQSEALNLPSGKYTNYSYLEESFLLRKTKSGYSFYKEANNDEEELILIGKMTLENNKIAFVNTNNKKVKAYFDASNNLIIEENKGTIRYKIQN